jgi:hypothetical protein
MSAVLWPVTARIVTALNQTNGAGEHETAMRLMKVVEEAGEASAAYIGMTGQNPRKGTTHTRADVADELCDVIIAATVALHAFTTAPPAVLDAKLHAVARRLHEVEVELTAWPTPEEAYATAPTIVCEIAWTAAVARTVAKSRSGDAADRDFWLRKAAVLDRIALQGTTGDDAGDVATNAAQRLMDMDDASVICDPRHYVRQQYAHWAKHQ